MIELSFILVIGKNFFFNFFKIQKSISFYVHTLCIVKSRVSFFSNQKWNYYFLIVKSFNIFYTIPILRRFSIENLQEKDPLIKLYRMVLLIGIKLIFCDFQIKKINFSSLKMYIAIKIKLIFQRGNFILTKKHLLNFFFKF